MNNIKKYATIAGLSFSLASTTLTGCGKIQTEKSNQITENTIIDDSKNKFTISDKDFKQLTKKQDYIKIQNELNKNLMNVPLDSKVYKYNNEKIVVLNSDLQESAVDYLSGIELSIDDTTELYPICDLRFFIEDFNIKPIGIDENIDSVSDNSISYIFDSNDIQNIFLEMKNKSITEQTLFKYNSCLAKYNKVLTEDDLALLSSEFNDMFSDSICLTNSNKIAIYNMDSINLIYSENGSTIVFGKIEEINGQTLDTNFNDILNLIDIEPLGYAVDRGLNTINSSKYELMESTYGREIMEAIDRYGIPILTYDMNSICEKYNKYKHNDLILSKVK